MRNWNQGKKGEDILFMFGFVMPNSTNTWDLVIVTDEIKKKLPPKEELEKMFDKMCF